MFKRPQHFQSGACFYGRFEPQHNLSTYPSLMTTTTNSVQHHRFGRVSSFQFSGLILQRLEGGLFIVTFRVFYTVYRQRRL